MKRAVAGSLFALSVGLNAYLLVVRRTHAAAHAQAPQPHEVPVPELQVPPRTIVAAPASSDHDELARRVTEIEARIDGLRVPMERWQHGKPTPESADAMRPFLDAVFRDLGSDASYSLDCRGGACRVSTASDEAAATRALQDPRRPDRWLYDMDFSDGAYLAPHQPVGDALGMALWWTIVNKVNAADCLTHAPTHGDLAVELGLDASHHVTVSVSGSLASEPLGACMRSAFAAAAATTPVPPEATGVYGQPLAWTFPPR